MQRSVEVIAEEAMRHECALVMHCLDHRNLSFVVDVAVAAMRKAFQQCLAQENVESAVLNLLAQSERYVPRLP